MTFLPATDRRFLSEAKHEYRIAVWDTIVTRLQCPEMSHALILPADNGAEIPIMLRRGFRADHIHAVDQSAAMLASLKRNPGSWRNRYPEVNIYGNSLARACERMRDDGIELDVANFDLCGNLSDPVYNEVRQAVSSGVLAQYAILALTMLKGREPATTVALLNRVGRSRVGFVLEEACSDRLSLNMIREEQYQSGSSPIVWGVATTDDYPRIDLNDPQCPWCRGPMWDNRKKKAAGTFSPRAPDFSCRNLCERGAKGFWLRADR